MRSIAWVASVALVLAITCSALAEEIPSYALSAIPTVSTLEIKDIELSMPSGLVYDPHRMLYISDAGRHAIYVVDPRGHGKIFAGMPDSRLGIGDGAFADGPLLTARFNHPMGLAITKDGDLLVADAGNHCLRRIHDGNVSTFAGNCGVKWNPRVINAPEPAFIWPMAIAIDDQSGDVFVADFLGGVKRVSVHAATSPIISAFGKGLFIGEVTGVSVADGWVFICDTLGTTRLQVNGSRREAAYAGLIPRGAWTIPPGNWNTDGIIRNNIQPLGMDFAGFPTSILALSSLDAVMLDARFHNVRFMHDYHDRIIAGNASPDSTFDIAGLKDGVGRAALFNTPLAIAKAPDGGFAVADAGNHAIRLLTPIEREEAFPPPSGVVNYHFRADEYRVALLGTSAVWTATDTPSSIQASIEATLAQSPALRTAHLRPHVVSFSFSGAKIPALIAYEKEVLSSEGFDSVVYLVNTATLPGDIMDKGVDVGSTNSWKPDLDRQCAEIASIGKEASMNTLMVELPFSWELAPWEGYDNSISIFNRNKFFNNTQQFQEAAGRMVAVLSASGLPTMNLYGAMMADEFNRDHHPFFGSLDFHPTPYGRKFTGEQIAGELLRRNLWQAALKH